MDQAILSVSVRISKSRPRVLAVADVFDALPSTRPHRSARSHEEALQTIARNRARLYEASVVDALAGLVYEDAIQYGYCFTH